MRSIVLLPLLLLLLLLAPLACAASVSLYGSSVNLTYTSDGTYLYVTVSHDYAAWIAIGWHAASDRFGDPTQMFVPMRRPLPSPLMHLLFREWPHHAHDTCSIAILPGVTSLTTLLSHL